MTLVLICALIGVVAGLMGGTLGLGGGVVIVPPLIYLFHGMGVDDAVVAQMASEYDTTVDVLRRDLAELLRELQEKGLVEMQSQSESGPTKGDTETPQP